MSPGKPSKIVKRRLVRCYKEMDQGDSKDVDVCRQILELENFEMASGVLNPSQYLNLLCLYLRNNNLMAARFLWKRIPSDCKTADPCLQAVWNLTILLLKRRNDEFLSSCREFLRSDDLSPSVQSHLSAVYQRIQRSTIDLIKSAFSCISIEKLCSMMSLPQDEAVSFMENWTPSSDGLFLIGPSVPHPCVKCVDQDKTITDFMRTLTEFSSFMENM
ncbi:COP9 signalosome complex subunit 8 [Echinococcus granulosus]|nr:COP9 signalosome complex subunit 8 [Echinococcus granulosus]